MAKPFIQEMSYHCFNGDGSMCAVSPNNHMIHIYNTNGSTDTTKWDKEPAHVLKEHTGYISGLDWHPKTNLIVSSAHDRNAYVWKYKDDESAWKPTLVILRINRAATDVKWSPSGDKFAVASGAKCVPVCHFEESNDWWISKMIKKHKSTVNSLQWSPNSKFLLTGGCDFKARIVSAFIDGIDSEEDDGFGEIFKKQHTFGEVLWEQDIKAWVNTVAFSPSGFEVCYAGHNSTMNFTTFAAGEKPGRNCVFTKELPASACAFVDDSTMVSIGYDRNPQLWKKEGDSWSISKKFDDEGASAKADSGKKPKKAFGSAFAKFQQADDQGHSVGSKKKAGNITDIKTQHTNYIGSMCIQDKTFTTAGHDGRLISWKLD